MPLGGYRGANKIPLKTVCISAAVVATISVGVLTHCICLHSSANPRTLDIA